MGLSACQEKLAGDNRVNGGVVFGGVLLSFPISMFVAKTRVALWSILLVQASMTMQARAQNLPPLLEIGFFLQGWRFDTTNQPTLYGHLPKGQGGVQLVPTWNTNAARLAGTGPAYLQYNIVETNGWTNLSVPRGSIWFWFRPLWSSTNLGGTGPGTSARLIELGDGNVAALIKASDGTSSGVYEYSAFGATIRETGAAAEINPFRFSTKFLDEESGFLDYGYRYLRDGWWINRDPVHELGGLNLSAFLNNSPLASTDLLGLCKKGDCEARFVRVKNIGAPWFTVQNAMGADIGLLPQQIVDSLLEAYRDGILEGLAPEVVNTVANRVKTILTIDKNVLLHWQFRFTADVAYELRRCECKKTVSWTFGLCCSQWGWSKPEAQEIGLKEEQGGSDSGHEFSPASKDAFVSAFKGAYEDAAATYIHGGSTPWIHVWQEKMSDSKTAKSLGCKSLKVVENFK